MGGGQPKDHVLLTLPFEEPPDLLKQFRSKYPDMGFSFEDVSKYRNAKKDAQSPELSQSIYKDVTVLVTLFTFPANPKVDAPLLDFIQLFSAGSNQVHKHPIFTDTDVPICTASGIHGPQIAEWVIMTQLVQTHKYKMLHDQQKKHQWGTHDELHKTSPYKVKDMVGQRLGVLGYGSIGRQVARVGKAMGMDVVAFTASPKETDDSKKDRGFIVPGTGDPDGSIPSAWYSGLDKPSLHKFLSQDIDLLLISVPLTNDTHHMLSSEEFAVLSHDGKKPAYVTNIARGPIIDHPALVSALKDGTLAGASLDVTEPEPLPSDSELWDMDNVIITPHVSGNGTSYNDRAFQLFEQQLERRKNGEKFLNVVQRKRGY